jgi:hypothetical protein
MEFSDVTYTGEPITDLSLLEVVPDNLRDFLKQVNGLIAFQGGLHIRGVGAVPNWHSLTEVWTGEYALHQVYHDIKRTDVPFAQDCLGDQFLIRDGVIYKLLAETGELEHLGLGFDAFLQAAIADPVEFLDLQPLLRFLRNGGILQPGQLLHVYPPFCSKESEQGVSFRSVPALENLSYLASLAKQIAHLKDGQEISIKVIDSEPKIDNESL